MLTRGLRDQGETLGDITQHPENRGRCNVCCRKGLQVGFGASKQVSGAIKPNSSHSFETGNLPIDRGQ